MPLSHLYDEKFTKTKKKKKKKKGNRKKSAFSEGVYFSPGL
jgi:hypothetical protein